MTVSVAHVLAGAAAHAVPLTAECVGYLVLGAADQVAGAPRSLAASDLVLSDDGVVRVMGGRAAGAEEAERDLRSVLDALLFCASSASPGLLRASRRPPGVGLEALVRELETALIPVNRSAAKRALARLQRETLRALETGRIRPDSAPPTAPAAEPRVPAPPVPVTSAPIAASAPPSIAAATPSTKSEEQEPSVELAHAALEPAATPSVHTAVTTVPPPMTVRPPRVSIPPAPKLPRSMERPVVEVRPPAPPLARTTADADAFSGAAVERTVVLAPVAARTSDAEQARESQLIETRPEPVVRRASARPPAPPPEALGDFGRTERLPAVVARVADFQAVPAPAETALGASGTALSVTPLLGTRVTEEAPNDLAVPMAGARDTLRSPAADDLPAPLDLVLEGLPEIIEDDILVEAEVEAAIEAEAVEAQAVEARAVEVVQADAPDTIAASADVTSGAGGADVFAAEELPTSQEPLSEIEDFEIVVLDPRGFVACSDETSAPLAMVAPSPLPAADLRVVDESLAAAPAEVAQGVVAELPVTNETADIADGAGTEETTVDAPAEPVELAVLVESALPPWVREPVAPVELTPPPRIARPEPRPSDVEELLRRLDEVPPPEEDVATKLRRLAGLDATPSPSNIERER